MRAAPNDYLEVRCLLYLGRLRMSGWQESTVSMSGSDAARQGPPYLRASKFDQTYSDNLSGLLPSCRLAFALEWQRATSSFAGWEKTVPLVHLRKYHRYS